jgi:hypothetical protein
VVVIEAEEIEVDQEADLAEIGAVEVSEDQDTTVDLAEVETEDLAARDVKVLFPEVDLQDQDFPDLMKMAEPVAPIFQPQDL